MNHLLLIFDSSRLTFGAQIFFSTSNREDSDVVLEGFQRLNIKDNILGSNFVFTSLRNRLIEGLELNLTDVNLVLVLLRDLDHAIRRWW